MKAKSSYTGLESISLSFSTKSTDLMKLPGDNSRMGIINDLFDSGNPDEARKVLRNALADISQNLDKILVTEHKNNHDAAVNITDTAFLKLTLER
jgi:LPS O-antigen subunit length determinant protein (WzzB/FepE family)